jgi:hypothetical protein
MMPKIVLFAIVASQLYGAVSSELVVGTGNCSVPLLKAAQQAFDLSLGINNTYDWSQPYVLMSAIQQVFANRTAGIVDVCNAYNAMLLSINKANMSVVQCFDPMFLIKNYNDPIAAYNYAGLMSYLRYQCEAGFYLAVDNWSCIQHTYALWQDYLTSCFYAANANQRNYPDDACYSSKATISCFQYPFNTQCSNDKNDGTIAYYACESARQFTRIAYRECDDVCTARPPVNQNSAVFALDDHETMDRLNKESTVGRRRANRRSAFMNMIGEEMTSIY